MFLLRDHLSIYVWFIQTAKEIKMKIFTSKSVGRGSLTLPSFHQHEYRGSTLDGITQARFDSWKGCLHNTFWFTSGGVSSGNWSKSIRAWPSLLYNLNTFFFPGMVTFWTSWKIQVLENLTLELLSRIHAKLHQKWIHGYGQFTRLQVFLTTRKCMKIDLGQFYLWLSIDFNKLVDAAKSRLPLTSYWKNGKKLKSQVRKKIQIRYLNGSQFQAHQ